MPAVLLGLLLAPAVAVAGEILSSSVVQDAGVYRLTVSARIDAPRATVYRTITDYDNLKAINPSILSSQAAATADPGTHHVHTVINVCILVFCKQVVQMQRVVQVDGRTIEAVMLPEQSDFRAGFARWALAGDGATTVLSFSEELEPDFWVPPVIGPWLIERQLVREVAETVRYIEQQEQLEQ